MPVRLIIGEDNILVREGLERMLDPSPGIDVVAADDSLEGLFKSVAAENPDVVLTDIRMPPTRTDEGLRLAAHLRAHNPEIGVLVLSQYVNPSYVLTLLEAGSDRRGYLLKERLASRGELVGAIDAVARGGSVVDPKVVEALIEARTRRKQSPLRDLTPREREVLQALAEGKSNSAIADALTLTKRAVEKRINVIFSKLGLAASEDVSKRVGAALMFLAEKDVVSIDDET